MTEQKTIPQKFIAGLYGFVNAFIPEVELSGQKIYKYGTDNLLPNNLLKWVNDSGIARRCVDKSAVYIEANGFANEAAAKYLVGSGNTANDLLNEIGLQLSYFAGFALHIKRDGTGAIKSISNVPFHCVRKRMDGGYEVNLTYGQPNYKKDKAKVYPAFAGQLNEGEFRARYNELQHGEILYAHIKAADNPHYPNPSYYAQIEDVRTSAELAKFDFETVTNGFIVSAILTYIGELDNKNRDEYGKTEQDYLRETLKEFTGQSKNSQGISGRNKLMVLTAKSAEQAPVLQPFDSKAIFEASNAKRDLIERAVCRLFGVPPVLVGFSDAAVLGNTQSIANASLELNKNIQPYQNLISKTFKRIYPDLDWTLTEYTPVNYIDSSLYQYMTTNEIRAKLLNLPPLNEAANGTN